MRTLLRELQRQGAGRGGAGDEEEVEADDDDAATAPMEEEPLLTMLLLRASSPLLRSPRQKHGASEGVVADLWRLARLASWLDEGARAV